MTHLIVDRLPDFRQCLGARLANCKTYDYSDLRDASGAAPGWDKHLPVETRGVWVDADRFQRYYNGSQTFYSCRVICGRDRGAWHEVRFALKPARNPQFFSVQLINLPADIEVYFETVKGAIEVALLRGAS